METTSRIAALIMWGISTALTPKCDRCGSSISGTTYKAYNKSYCYTCAHRLYPNATWK